MQDPAHRWRDRVGRVFNVRPRIGVGKGKVWLARTPEMTALRDNFFSPGSHVCFDGPSGAGKTSLALTFLVREKLPFVYVPVTRSLTWADFCRLLLKPVDNTELGMTLDMDVGIDKGLPTAKLRVSLGRKGRPGDDVDWATKTAEAWSEDHVAHELCERDVALVIDDAERASDGLLSRLADLTKLMTLREASLATKICFIGTDQLFRRLLHTNPSLEERLLETTLGAFNDHRHSWHFLSIGFERLRLGHPGTSPVALERDRLEACIGAVYDAADGLPKSLNALGQKIALSIRPGQEFVQVADILTASQRMAERNWRQYGHDFPRVLRVLDEHPICRGIVRALYRNGIARIHHATDLFLGLVEEAREAATPLSEAIVRESLEQLAAVDFLVLTGSSGEVVYVTRPTAAHALGVAMRDARQYMAITTQVQAKAEIAQSFPRQAMREGEAPQVEG